MQSSLHDTVQQMWLVGIHVSPHVNSINETIPRPHTWATCVRRPRPRQSWREHPHTPLKDPCVCRWKSPPPLEYSHMLTFRQASKQEARWTKSRNCLTYRAPHTIVSQRSAFLPSTVPTTLTKCSDQKRNQALVHVANRIIGFTVLPSIVER